MSKNIAFVKFGSFSHANQSLLAQFEELFPDFGIDVIDVLPLIKRRKGILLINLLYVLLEYGLRIVRGKSSFKGSFFFTTYMFRKCGEIAAEQICRDRHVFSFQTQSMFDASSRGVPHFVYTDHTALANLRYPDCQSVHDLKVTERWIELERTIYQNATVNFTMSNHISRSIAEDYGCPQEKIVRALAGSNVDLSAMPRHKRYDQKNILFVGVDWERKGGPLLLEAFKQVLQSHPQARLTIVGCSPEVDVPNCRVVGRVPKAEVGRYYADASIFCLPTRLEPFGMVFIEAIAYRLPIVASNIAAIPDFVYPGQNGYTVEPDDVDGLADALCALIGDPAKCEAFGNFGHAMFSELYSWESVATVLKEVISMHVPLYVPVFQPRRPTMSAKVNAQVNAQVNAKVSVDAAQTGRTDLQEWGGAQLQGAG